jgi:hypothetical protein
MRQESGWLRDQIPLLEWSSVTWGWVDIPGYEHHSGQHGWMPASTRRRPAAHARAAASVLTGFALAGCSAGASVATADWPELPVSATALITTTTTTTTSTTTTTRAPAPVTAAPPTRRRPAPSPSPPATPPAAVPRVLVIGDSVLLAAKASIPSAMSGWRVTLDAAESRRISAFAGVLAAAGGPSPYRAVVVHLCTNYSRGGGFARALDRAMAALVAVPRIVWMTCVEWSHGPAEANEIIRAATNRYGNVVVADWAVIADAPGYTWADGIHIRPEGQRAAADLVAAAVGPA